MASIKKVVFLSWILISSKVVFIIFMEIIFWVFLVIYYPSTIIIVISIVTDL